MISPNPILGVFFHWLGGLASGSFYVPYRGVRHWSWETYWLVGGFFSWIIAPWALGLFMTNDLPAVIRETPAASLFWSYFFGMLWGLGGLTFGLTMRYLGHVAWHGGGAWLLRRLRHARASHLQWRVCRAKFSAPRPDRSSFSASPSAWPASGSPDSPA